MKVIRCLKCNAKSSFTGLSPGTVVYCTTCHAPLASFAAGREVEGTPACTYCTEVISFGEVRVICPTCAIEYHTECWDENGGCAVYGCIHGPKVTAKTPVPSGPTQNPYSSGRPFFTPPPPEPGGNYDEIPKPSGKDVMPENIEVTLNKIASTVGIFLLGGTAGMCFWGLLMLVIWVVGCLCMVIGTSISMFGTFLLSERFIRCIFWPLTIICPVAGGWLLWCYRAKISQFFKDPFW